MARQSSSIRLFDFSGGLNTNSPVTSLKMNEALDLQNINIFGNEGKSGFEKRRGNTLFNSVAMASGAAIHGLAYYRLSNATDYLIAIAGTKIFQSASLNGVMNDITGTVTITTGATNMWTMSTMNDLLIAVGGAPDAPIKWNATGNAAVLGGTPPSGNFGLTANNRFFIGTYANSNIAWSVLGDPQDWSGSGSGNQNVSLKDGDGLVGAVQLGIDHLICFKENSFHDLNIRNAPFPLFTLRRGANIGAISKFGIVPVGNLIYYITPEPRMKATDGNQIFDFPDSIDNVWDGLNKSNLKYIQGLYYPRLHQIWWICANGSSTTNNYCIIWDLKNKCWLRHPTGFKMNAICLAQDRLPYGGAYDGKIYQMDKASTYTDASETSPGTINAYWRSGWHDFNAMIEGKIHTYIELNFTGQVSGSFDFGYGFDFVSDRTIVPISQIKPGDKWGQMLWGIGKWGGQSDITKLVFINGKGKFLQFLLRNNNASELFSFNGIELPVKLASPILINS